MAIPWPPRMDLPEDLSSLGGGGSGTSHISKEVTFGNSEEASLEREKSVCDAQFERRPSRVTREFGSERKWVTLCQVFRMVLGT